MNILTTHRHDKVCFDGQSQGMVCCLTVIMGALQTSHMSLHVCCYVKFAIFVNFK